MAQLGKGARPEDAWSSELSSKNRPPKKQLSILKYERRQTQVKNIPQYKGYFPKHLLKKRFRLFLTCKEMKSFEDPGEVIFKACSRKGSTESP